MSVLEKARAVAQQKRMRVVFPEIDEPRIAQASTRLAAEGLCEVLAPLEVSEAQVAALVEARGMKETLARRLLSKPMYRAAAMVAAGEADAMVAGAEAPTRRVIEAASMSIGLAEGIEVPSSFFLMRFPNGQELIFADCGLNVAPDAAELAAIARASFATGQRLLEKPELALLSFSTGTSGAGDSVEMVREVAQATGFTGPLQADAALNAGIAAKKGMGAGQANILVFPSLDAGNIAYKLCQELAGAQALGPILQGFRHPVCDLSRGATVDDIVNATIVTLALK